MIAFIAVHLWQSTLVVIAAWLLAQACRNNAAAIRYWIWFSASAKFFVPLALLQWLGDGFGRSLAEPLPLAPALIEAANAIFIPSVPDSLAIPEGILQRIQVVAVAIWAVGTALSLLRWLLQWCAVRSALAFATQVSMDLPAPVRVASDDMTTGVFGIFRPVVILPRTVIRELQPEQLQAVLAHEVCHLHRRDNLTAAIHKCVEAIFWFHPLVWWIGANLLRERETACDESVVAAGHEQGVYAQSILNVCRLGIATKFSGVAASTGGDLTQRISSIMSKERLQPIGYGRFTLLLVAATLVCFAPIAAGIVAGAVREASDVGPVSFDAITLKPSAPAWRRSTRFDPDAGRIVLKNVSLRQLIASAYPAARVTGESRVIDRARYDIDARWHGQGGRSERNVHRKLLENIVRTNFNVQIHIRDLCGKEC
jgi:beta-lactamase regulating signal transducer with metallopeptidase domain